MCNKTDKPLARLTTNKREDNLLRSGKKQEICSRPYRHQRRAREYDELHKNEFDNVHKINYIFLKMWYLISELQKRIKCQY